jgi:membrane protease YdiL (CAAX protease family)
MTTMITPRNRIGLRWAEMLALFVGTPLVLAFLLPPSMMFTVLGVTTFAGIVLLHITPGFSWGELNRGQFDWRSLALLAAGTVATSAIAVMVLMPENALILPRTQTGLWLMIMLLYPLASALPQEVIFRPLFFRRYGDLMPAGSLIWVNAALFSLAHLMYWDVLVLAMTFCGGLAFAWAYHVRGSFWLAVVMHAVAGQIVFTSGLGRLFYSGAV